MSICLIGAPTVTEFQEAAEAESEQVLENAAEPQLGVLSLAAVLESKQYAVRVVDLNRLYYAHLATRWEGEDFCGPASFAIASQPADVYGFSSICSSYPLSIRIAAEVKRARPKSLIVFGGPQASVVDAETLATFPFIDLILRGEAERTFPALLHEIAGEGHFRDIPGLTFRNHSRVVRNPNAPVIEDLDSIPTPAYHLVEDVDKLTYASLELGRGCPFACKFCSTNDFFRRRFRVKSPRRMLDEMRFIAARFGFRQFDLIHDMFTVDRKRVVAFCNELLDSGDRFRWSCSARTDCVDNELLELMARAGCTGIFFGIEAGSPRMQKIIDKHLDIPYAREMVDSAERHGIETTVSLITGFPEEEDSDLRGTIDFYMHAVRAPHATPQLNLLAPLAATPIHHKHRDELVLDDLCSDISHQGRFQNVVDRLLIECHRDIFPNFYLLPTPYLNRSYVLELREFLLMATARIRWLLAALDLSGPGILDIFSEWRHYRLDHRPGLAGGELRHYYRLRIFRHDFLDFLRPHMKRWSSFSVQALFDYEEALRHAIAEDEKLPPNEMEPASQPFEWSDRPKRQPRVHVLEMNWDIQAVLKSVQKREQPGDDVRQHGFYVTRPISKESTRLSSISSAAACVLKLSTGERTMGELADRFNSVYVGTEKLPNDLVYTSLIESLVKKGLLAIYRTGAAAISSTANPEAIAAI